MENILTVQSWRKDEIRFEIFGNGDYIHTDNVAEYIKNNASRLASEILSNHQREQSK